MIIIGDQVNSAVRVGAYPGAAVVVIPEIDLTAATLDSRVAYTGPAHTYLNGSKQMVQSAANEWPLEYRNGVLQGRHEPEKAATNYIPSTNFERIAASASDSVDWVWSTGSGVTVADSDLGVKASISGNSNTNVALYNEASAAFILAQTAVTSTNQWAAIVQKVTNTTLGTLRWYTARQSTTSYIYGKGLAVPAGDIVCSVVRRMDSDSVDCALAQIELGTIRTSPIINGAGETKTRAASTVKITEARASSAEVTFSNGDKLTLTPTDGVFTLPQATLDWGTRFAQTIAFTR